MSAAGVARAALVPSLVGLVSVAVYRSTLLPGVGLWDTAEFQTVGPLLGTAHPTGYPAYVVLGWLASTILEPLGSPAFRMNLLSAALVALAAGVLAALVRALTGRASVALAVGLGFAATPAAWGVSTRADPHALHVALVAILLALLVAWATRRERSAPTADRWLLGTAVALGVSLANQALTVFLVPAIGLYVSAVEPGIVRRVRFLAALGAVVAGVAGLLYLELPLRAGPFRAPLVYGHPETWDGFWYVVLGQQFRGDFQADGGLAGVVGELVSVAAAELGPLALLLPVAFAVAAVRRPAFALLTGLPFGATVAFASVYVNAWIERYYLGPLVIAWVWLGILGAAVLDALERSRGAAAMPGADPARADPADP
ncbi:MAG TPA: DUF2723 domain-containing protein, partial [Candidatus Limnocylindrales bacterium]|nr:DUF2723 domain-containing protein [Candidatus Limnocylindrales bacterium]